MAPGADFQVVGSHATIVYPTWTVVYTAFRLHNGKLSPQLSGDAILSILLYLQFLYLQ